MSNTAKEDLIRIHQFGTKQFGIKQADKYFEAFFDYFDIISNNPFSFESVNHIRKGYRKCPCGSDTIYFKVQKDTIKIMAIVGKQEIENII